MFVLYTVKYNMDGSSGGWVHVCIVYMKTTKDDMSSILFGGYYGTQY